MEKLISTYEHICNKLVKAFCKKQELEFEFWAGDLVGGTAYFSGEFFFKFTDIVLDLKQDYTAGEIVKWYWHDLEHNQDKTHSERDFLSYQSYVKGERHE